MHWRDVRATGADIVLGNTYHLMLRPAPSAIAALGGLHEFIELAAADPDRFRRLPGDVARRAAQARRERRHIPLASRRRHRGTHAGARDRDPDAARLRHRHAARRVPAPAGRAPRSSAPCSCRCAGRSAASAPSARRRRASALFGIVQGGDDRDLRVASARALADIGFDGYAIGGLAVGEPQEVMLEMVETVVPRAAGGRAALPDGRRHARRSARSGRARHRHVRLRAADAQRPPRPRLSRASARSTCGMPATPTIRARSTTRAACPAAREYSRAYLHHLTKASEILGAMLATSQPLLLPGADAGHARGDRGRTARGLPLGREGRVGEGGLAGGVIEGRSYGRRRYSSGGSVSGRWMEPRIECKRLLQSQRIGSRRFAGDEDEIPAVKYRYRARNDHKLMHAQQLVSECLLPCARNSRAQPVGVGHIGRLHDAHTRWLGNVYCGQDVRNDVQRSETRVSRDLQDRSCGINRAVDRTHAPAVPPCAYSVGSLATVPTRRELGSVELPRNQFATAERRRQGNHAYAP